MSEPTKKRVLESVTMSVEATVRESAMLDMGPEDFDKHLTVLLNASCEVVYKGFIDRYKKTRAEAEAGMIDLSHVTKKPVIEVVPG